MKILLLGDKSVREVRTSHPALKGKKLIASGMFSGVFEGRTEDTVLKLTICPASYALLTDKQFVGVKHAPQLIKDYGMVGTFTTGGNMKETKLSKPVIKTVPMYLVEVERLHKLPTGQTRNLVAYIAKAIKRASTETIEGETHRGNQAQRLVDLIESPKLESIKESYATYVNAINQFVATHQDAFYDMHAANFMQRNDGTMVFSDPVGSMDIYSTQGLFSKANNSDIDWTDVRREHREKFSYLLQKTA